MYYIISFIVLACLSYRYWRHKYLPAEVAQNADAIKSNGGQDDLQRGFHGREVWSRVWPGLACCLVPSVAPAIEEWASWKVFDLGTPPNWWAVPLAFAATAALLLGVFVRDFTPKLNLARIANGDTWLSEWFASPASKSWPDAGSWKATRAKYADSAAPVLGYDQQAYANACLRRTILRTYRLCLAAALLLAATAVVVAL